MTSWGIRERERETGREIFKHEGRGRWGNGEQEDTLPKTPRGDQDEEEEKEDDEEEEGLFKANAVN